MASVQALLAASLSRQGDPNRSRIGEAGWTKYSDLESLEVKGYGLGNFSAGPTLGLQLDIAADARDNLVIAPPIRALQLLVSISGSGNVIFLPRSTKIAGRVIVDGDNNLLFFGEGSTCNKGNFVLRSDERSVILGDDCMLSYDISVRCGDMHSIFDIESLAITNSPESILVHPHVWLAEGCAVLKGVQIGKGSILGARGVATSNIPDYSLAVGVPARTLRSGVSWTRSRKPTREDLNTVKIELLD